MTTQYKIFFIALAAISAISAIAVFGFDYTSVYQENRWLENMQVLVLVAGFVISLRALVKGERNDKLVLAFVAFLMYSFTLRELDVETLSVPAWVVSMGSGTGRNIIGAIVLLTILAIGLFNVKYYWGLAKSAFKHPLIKYLAACIAFLLVSDVAERLTFLAHYAFYEELAELLGFSMLLCAANELIKKPLDTGY